MEESFRQTRPIADGTLESILLFKSKVTVGVMLSGYKDREKGTFFCVLFSLFCTLFYFITYLFYHKGGFLCQTVMK